MEQEWLAGDKFYAWLCDRYGEQNLQAYAPLTHGRKGKDYDLWSRRLYAWRVEGNALSYYTADNYLTAVQGDPGAMYEIPDDCWCEDPRQAARKAKYDDDFKANVVAAYIEGFTATEVAEMYGIHPSTVTLWRAELRDRAAAA